MKTIKFINLTGHDINLVDVEGKLIHLFKFQDKPVRCPLRTETEEWVMIDGTEIRVPLTRTTYSDPILPDPIPYTLYIVSEVVARRFKETRDDLRITNGLVKIGGKTMGCRSLGRV
jgi:hypothetical protein